MPKSSQVSSTHVCNRAMTHSVLRSKALGGRLKALLRPGDQPSHVPSGEGTQTPVQERWHWKRCVMDKILCVTLGATAEGALLSVSQQSIACIRGEGQGAAATAVSPSPPSPSQGITARPTWRAGASAAGCPWVSKVRSRSQR